MTHHLNTTLSVACIALRYGAAMPKNDFPPRTGTGPTDPAYIVSSALSRKGVEAGRMIAVARFGTMQPEPAWAMKKAGRSYNQRREILSPYVKCGDLEQPNWQDLMLGRRCFVPVQGYYDWVPAGPSRPKDKDRFAVEYVEGEPMALAALYDHYGEVRDGIVPRFSIITVPCKGNAAAPDGWMPAMLNKADIGAWLGEDGSEHNSEQLMPLLRPTPAALLNRHRLSDVVVTAADDGEGLIHP